MTGLARRLGAVLPTEAASPPAWRAHDPLREILARLTIAAELHDDAAVDRLIDQALDHPYLGRRLAGRVIVRTGEALAGQGPPPS